MDDEAKKSSLRMINYGLYVLTAKEGSEIAAGTVNWLSQASFKPPLVMVGVRGDSSIHSLIERTRNFAVNVLGKDQKDLAGEFFKPTKIDGEKMNGTSFKLGSTGAPILIETPASFECKVIDVVRRGDHSIVVGEVIDAQVRSDIEPLFMRTTGWFYGG